MIRDRRIPLYAGEKGAVLGTAAEHSIAVPGGLAQAFDCPRAPMWPSDFGQDELGARQRAVR